MLQKNKVIELFKKCLASDVSEPIINKILRYIQQDPQAIKDVSGKLVDFARKSKFKSTTDQCVQIFVTNKDKFSRHVDEIEKIFGTGILD